MLCPKDREVKSSRLTLPGGTATVVKIVSREIEDRYHGQLNEEEGPVLGDKARSASLTKRKRLEIGRMGSPSLMENKTIARALIYGVFGVSTAIYK